MEDLDAKTWAIIGGCIIGVVVLLILIIDSNVITDKEAKLLAPRVALRAQNSASQTARVGSIVPTQDEALDQVNVYVDRTLSMRPFTTAEQSPYFGLLKESAGLLAGNIKFLGFGYPSEEQGQVVKPVDPILLEEPSQYTFVNNDYGPLFSNLDSSETHLVLSDGVQSEPKEGERFGGIVSSIGDWLEQGGVFALMAYRAPYQGTYYHEAPTVGQVDYNCENRPFYAFGFFPSVNAKEELIGILENGDVAPQYMLMIGEENASIVVREHARPDNPDARTGPLALTSLRDHSDASPDIGHVYSGRPTTKEGGGTPLHFEVEFDTTSTLWQSLPEDKMERVAQSLDPSFQHWRIDTLSVERERVVLTSLNSPRIQNVTSQLGKSQWKAHLTTPMTFESTGGPGKVRLASLLTLGVSPAGANAFIPDDYSTRRDDKPSKCSRTLNLQRTIGAVLREHYVFGRALLVTEW